MNIYSFEIERELVEKGMQEEGKFLRVSSPCLCGCSPLPFVSISDGRMGITVGFETQEELNTFKSEARKLTLNPGGNK